MEPVTLQRIDRAIRIVAGLIDQTGEDFWPVLDRLEKERAALAEREARLAKYLRAGTRGVKTRPVVQRARLSSGAPRSGQRQRPSASPSNASSTDDLR